MAVINLLVEGWIDEAVATRLVRAAGHDVGSCFGRQGCGYIRKKIGAFNRSAEGMNVLSLVDLMDTRLACPVEVLSSWLPERHSNMLFRIVVREIESWLLADSESLAEFLAVNPRTMPRDVETLEDPKRTLINIARKSGRRQIKDAIVPTGNTTATEGILYNEEMMRFVKEFWNIEVACAHSPSLGKCFYRLQEFK